MRNHCRIPFIAPDGAGCTVATHWFIWVIEALILVACSLLMPSELMALAPTIFSFFRGVWGGFAYRFPKFSRHIATWGWAEMFGLALAFEEAHEYGMALVLVSVAATSLVATCIHWQGFQEDPKLTKVVRLLGCVGALIIVGIGLLYVFGAKDGQDWSRLPTYWNTLWRRNPAQPKSKESASTPRAAPEHQDSPADTTTMAKNADKRASGKPKAGNGKPSVVPQPSPAPPKGPCREDSLQNCSTAELYQKVTRLIQNIQPLIDDMQKRIKYANEADWARRDDPDRDKYKQSEAFALGVFITHDMREYTTNYRDAAVRYRAELVGRLGPQAPALGYEPSDAHDLAILVKELRDLADELNRRSP